MRSETRVAAVGVSRGRRVPSRRRCGCSVVADGRVQARGAVGARGHAPRVICRDGGQLRRAGVDAHGRRLLGAVMGAERGTETPGRAGRVCRGGPPGRL